MRRGMSILELMASIALLAILLAVSAPMIRDLAVEPPRALHASQTHRLLGDMTLALQRDLRQATDLPQAAGSAQADERNLLIEQGPEVLHYQVRDEGIYRSRLGPDGPAEGTDFWPAPDAEVRWTVRREAGRPIAIEVRTAVLVSRNLRTTPALANSRVLFVGEAFARPAPPRDEDDGTAGPSSPGSDSTGGEP